MNKLLYISTDSKLPLSMDYKSLQKEFMQEIEDLSHEKWTDKNTHDPGVTIADIIPYIISDISYRCNLPIENLLTNKKGVIDNVTFFPASEICTKDALSEMDYRRRLIDIKGVENAWLLYNRKDPESDTKNLPLKSEKSIYINVLEDKLSRSDRDRKDQILSELYPRGLNSVRIQLSRDLEYGDLNKVAIELEDFYADHFLQVEIITDFNDWSNEKADFFMRLNSASKLKSKICTLNEDKGRIKITLEHQTNPSIVLELDVYSSDASELTILLDYFDTMDKSTFCTNVIKKFQDKKNKVDSIYHKIFQVLSANRNLCEDWMCVESIKSQDIGICAKIIFEANADIEKTLVHVYEKIQKIISPSIEFHSLAELLNKGYTTEQIYNGPKLKHGFLLDEEVQKSVIPSCLHASDFIREIMEIEGVEDVKDFMFTAYDMDGKALEASSNNKWILPLSGNTYPMFNQNKSRLMLYKGDIPFSLTESAQQKLKASLYNLSMATELSKMKGAIQDIDLPTAKYMPLHEYKSIQDEFPEVYKIGKDQMPKEESSLRKAQAKQLKAYLLHFDQQYSDLLQLLEKAKDLLDIRELDSTYFPSYFRNISGVEVNNLCDELYAPDFQNYLWQRNEDDYKNLYESNRIYYQRMNSFLDHLMARFGYSFDQYMNTMYRMQQNAKGIAELKIQDNELLLDKRRFLSQLATLGSQSSKGFDYMHDPNSPDIWGNVPISGYQQKVARLLGINCDLLQDTPIKSDTPSQSWSYDTELGILPFRLLSNSGLSLKLRWDIAHNLVHDVSAYQVRSTNSGYCIDLVNEDNQPIAKYNRNFVSYQEAYEFIPDLYQAINSSLENFFVLEHILLRPLLDLPGQDLEEQDRQLLKVCLQDECFQAANADPYSFKVTIVLPGYLARFRNVYFREYAENIFRLEAPAHVMVKVCWVDEAEMKEFQEKYHSWISAYRNVKPKLCKSLSQTVKNKYNKALTELVDITSRLNTIYEQGSLYDCHGEASENPIILGKTSLGSL